MPSREPTFYRWAQDKPCTTNQTYGYELRMQSSTRADGCGISNNSKCKKSCSGCPSEMQTAACKQQRPQHQRPFSTSTSLANYSTEVAYKPINRGYTTGYIPITKKIAKQAGSASGAHQRRGMTGPSAHGHSQSKGEDLYMWHALSGTLVHCKNYGSPDE
jgi:hypothetical protein